MPKSYKKVILQQENRDMQISMEKSIETNFLTERVGDTIELEYFLTQERYIRSLESKINQNNLKIKEYEPVIKERQDELIEATKEKKIIEKLKEKDYERYKDEKNKFDTKNIDEIAGIIQIRRDKLTKRDRDENF